MIGFYVQLSSCFFVCCFRLLMDLEVNSFYPYLIYAKIQRFFIQECSKHAFISSTQIRLLAFYSRECIIFWSLREKANVETQIICYSINSLCYSINQPSISSTFWLKRTITTTKATYNRIATASRISNQQLVNYFCCFIAAWNSDRSRFIASIDWLD